MVISPNEIKNRALAFSVEWALETREDAEAKTFWDQFFEVFGVTRRRVASFEHLVKKPDGTQGFADLFWKGNLIVEHKSRGKNLDSAYKQVTDYFPGLKEEELPRYIIVSDFEKFRVYDLDENKQVDFFTRELSKHIDLFGFISGHENQFDYVAEIEANIEAAELMADFHNEISKTGYSGSDLEVFLIRILFCLFADDTGIFPKNAFRNYINNRFKNDGSDLGAKLAEIFQVLNTPEKDRQTNLDDDLRKFPYVNGGIFSKNIGIVSCDVTTLIRLKKCCSFNWAKISAAIFGSLFQGVMEEKARRHLGAHYTSEQNILKLIKSLFLDDLRIELDDVKYNPKRLDVFHSKLGKLKFLDPACGCGNFLVIAYRELRKLEVEILKIKSNNGEKLPDDPTRVNIDQFYGIEIEEFPARIAEVAMHLVDHQINTELNEVLGKYIHRLPIQRSATIRHADALSFDWGDLVSKNELSYILGNPPFYGARLMSEGQKEGLLSAFDNMKGAGNLDFVTAWYAKSAKYIQETKIKVAFVSTNSISQGEQVGLLWKYLKDFNIKIHFAHQTFKWSNDAAGVAAVYCVIIGFGTFDVERKYLYEYEDIKGASKEKEVGHINPYLVEGEDILIENHDKPISDCPPINYGSFALDDGNYTLTEEEKDDLINNSQLSEKYIRPFIGARELLHKESRYCLWLKDADPTEIRGLPKIVERIENVRKWREASARKNTKDLAKTPNLFAEVRQPSTSYLTLPTVSSENRDYIPMAFLEPNIIASNQIYIIANASRYGFGILQSKMHMVWVKYICGRLKSDYRYSSTLVYNNFPWPENVLEDKKKKVEECTDHVIFIRTLYPRSSLADLYDPNSMPSDLREAHEKLDKAVEFCYDRKFKDDQERISFLFELYKNYISKENGKVPKTKIIKKAKA